jgi:cytosolic carboxypeptidase protein 5
MDQNATNGPLPTQSHFFFSDDGVDFTSVFDSGNLARVERSSSRSYQLWIGPDCMNTQAENSCRSWFYFKVTATQPQTLFFLIKNLNLQFKVFREGMKPVVKTGNRWERIPGQVSFNLNEDDTSSMELSFSHHVSGETFLAFTYPWSYEEHKELLREVRKSAGISGIYYHEENLINSLEGRECQAVTISSMSGVMEESEKNIQNLYPGGGERARMFGGKKYMLLTARVHPGETQGSFMMNGFLKFIVSDDPRAVQLRDCFVFKIVPVLNPDGVVRGHYRTDTRGINLNRFYTAPSLVDHPTIYAVKELFVSLKDLIYCYIDLHGHATKKGCFVYGNYMEFGKEIECYLFAKLMALNCINFDYEGSNFTEKNMRAKDKRGLSKEGSGRVALFKSSGLPRCYTLECNFNSGKVLNTICQSGLPEPPECDNSDPMYAKPLVDYTVGIYEDVGRAIGISLLDNLLKNPYSRVLKNDPDLKTLKAEVASFIATQAPFRFDPVIKKAVKNKEELNKFISEGGKKQSEKSEKKVSIAKTSEVIRAPRISKTLQPVATECEIRPSKRIIISDSPNKKEDSAVVPIKNYMFPAMQKPVAQKKNLIPKKHGKTVVKRAKIKIDTQSFTIESESKNSMVVEVMAE